MYTNIHVHVYTDLAYQVPAHTHILPHSLYTIFHDALFPPSFLCSPLPSPLPHSIPIPCSPLPALSPAPPSLPVPCSSFPYFPSHLIPLLPFHCSLTHLIPLPPSLAPLPSVCPSHTSPLIHLLHLLPCILPYICIFPCSSLPLFLLHTSKTQIFFVLVVEGNYPPPPRPLPDLGLVKTSVSTVLLMDMQSAIARIFD